MREIFIIGGVAIILSCTTASSQVVTRTVQVNMLEKSNIVLVASKKRKGLSGQSGNVRKRGPRGRRGCAKGYNAYIAASGHSAYAQTPSQGYAGGAICGWSLNVSSAKAAEKSALGGCNAGLKKYKIDIRGKCSIFASK